MSIFVGGFGRRLRMTKEEKAREVAAAAVERCKRFGHAAGAVEWACPSCIQAAVEEAESAKEAEGQHAGKASVWIIRYEDTEMQDEVFIGAGAEAAARATFARRNASWNCWLLTAVDGPNGVGCSRCSRA